MKKLEKIITFIPLDKDKKSFIKYIWYIKIIKI